MVDKDGPGPCPHCGGASDGSVVCSDPLMTKCGSCGRYWPYGDLNLTGEIEKRLGARFQDEKAEFEFELLVRIVANEKGMSRDEVMSNAKLLNMRLDEKADEIHKVQESPDDYTLGEKIAIGVEHILRGRGVAHDQIIIAEWGAVRVGGLLLQMAIDMDRAADVIDLGALADEIQKEIE